MIIKKYNSTVKIRFDVMLYELSALEMTSNCKKTNDKIVKGR
jgi:hypothetical protein